MTDKPVVGSSNYRNVHELVSDLVACALIEGARPTLTASLETKRVKQLLLDEIEQRSRDLRRAKSAMVRHGVEETLPGNHPSNAPETKPARDADHCDFPDCEQHNALVVMRLEEALDWVLRERLTFQDGAFLQRAEANTINPSHGGWYSFPSIPDQISSVLSQARARVTLNGGEQA